MTDVNAEDLPLSKIVRPPGSISTLAAPLKGLNSSRFSYSRNLVKVGFDRLGLACLRSTAWRPTIQHDGHRHVRYYELCIFPQCGNR
jgi:hypothetical protein